MPIKPDNRDQGAFEERGKILRKVRNMIRDRQIGRGFYEETALGLIDLEDWIKARHTRVNKRKGGLGKP